MVLKNYNVIFTKMSNELVTVSQARLIPSVLDYYFSFLFKYFQARCEVRLFSKEDLQYYIILFIIIGFITVLIMPAVKPAWFSKEDLKSETIDIFGRKLDPISRARYLTD